MNAKLAVAMALFASLVYPQSANKTPANKAPSNKTTVENRAAVPGQAATEENAAATSDQATKEAQRQGRVALNPQAQQSPAQTVDQAVAFERYKELAAEREARKEGVSTESARSADRSVDTQRPVKAKPAKKQ
jgi:hypothetical protein